MREIRFRVPVFSHSTKKFLRFEYWSALHMCFSYSVPNIVSNDDVYGEDEQYTGLRDKNGKEIYEGDILEHHSGLVPKGSNPNVRQVVAWAQYQYKGINNWGNSTVVGNIHENPDLIK